jgi:hypothetical protein
MLLFLEKILIHLGMTNTQTTTTSAYKIETLTNSFVVSDDYNMYGAYYKTLKGAEKQLKKVRYQAGELN